MSEADVSFAIGDRGAVTNHPRLRGCRFTVIEIEQKFGFVMLRVEFDTDVESRHYTDSHKRRCKQPLRWFRSDHVRMLNAIEQIGDLGR